MKTKYHKDNTVTFWNIYLQQWQRLSVSNIPATILATLSDSERVRIAKMAAAAK